MILRKIQNSKTGKVGLVPADENSEDILHALPENEDMVFHRVEIKIDLDRYKKYYQLISIFEKNLSEILELQIFCGYEIGTKEKRKEYLDQHIRLSLGFFDTKPCNIGIPPNQIIRALPVAKSKNDITNDEWAVLYAKARDYIFTSLRNCGWSDQQLEEAFECLYLGIPKEDYDNLKIMKNGQAKSE